MYILDVTPITDSAQMPIKKGSLQFLQDAYTNITNNSIQALIKTLYGDYVNTTPYVLWGMKQTDAGPLWSIAPGAVFYMNKVYGFNNALVTKPTGGNVFILNTNTTQYTVDADPVTFTDTTVHNVHNIVTISLATGASGSGTVADLSDLVYPLVEIFDTTQTRFNGNFLRFGQSQTIEYTGTEPASGVLSIALSIGAFSVPGMKVRCILKLDPGSSIITSITETAVFGSLYIVEKPSIALPASPFTQAYVEYEYLGFDGTDFVVARTINAF